MMNLNDAISWIADLFDEPIENVKPETIREDISGWDSLGILTLISVLDEEFDIILTEEELQEIHKVEDILNVFQKHGHLNE